MQDDVFRFCVFMHRQHFSVNRPEVDKVVGRCCPRGVHGAALKIVDPDEVLNMRKWLLSPIGIVAASVDAHPAPWPMCHRDQSRAGNARSGPFEEMTAPVRMESCVSDDTGSSAAAGTDGMVYVSSNGDGVWALTADGELGWGSQGNDGTPSSAVPGDGFGVGEVAPTRWAARIGPPHPIGESRLRAIPDGRGGSRGVQDV